MKTLKFNAPNNLSLFHDELLAAIPALRPVANQDRGLEAVIRVEGSDSGIWLTVPDNADEAAIAAVVAAHDPTAKQADPKAERQTRIAELLAKPRSDWTAAQQRELLQVAAQELTR